LEPPQELIEEKRIEGKPLAPAWYIPSLYFIEGLPNAIVNLMSAVLLKNLNFDNSIIGLYTSLLYIPWTIKFAWAPLVDLLFTRRRWILVSHLILAFLLVAQSGAVLNQAGLAIYLVLFALISLISATQDVAIDGFYLDVLDKRQQALYVGVRNASYQTGMLFASGAMVSLAGYWMERANDHQKGMLEGWALSFGICAGMFALATAWHLYSLPKLGAPKRVLNQGEVSKQPWRSQLRHRLAGFFQVFLSFGQQPRFAVIVLYILIFRMGEAFSMKMAPLFLLDPAVKGGLGISTAHVGLIYGTVGVAALLVGGLTGGFLAAKFGLKKCLLPTALFQNSAILIYWVLGILRPGLTVVGMAIGLERFAYGVGTAAYTVFLLSVVKTEYRAAHYAIATGLMALGLVLPGAHSGYLADCMGYQNFFLFSFFSAIPGIICIFYLPIRQNPDPSLPFNQKR
jgi:PAT family beta-lactamase induction signal transducer AmpG